MTLAQRVMFLMVLVAVTCGASFAQVTTGTPPFGSFDNASGPDVINLANLNSHIAVPILHKPGRGTDFTYDMSYDSTIWYPVTSGSTTTWQPVNNWGWRALTEVSSGYVSYTATIYQTGECRETDYSYVYHDPWGVPHAFPGVAERFTGVPSHCDVEWVGLNSQANDGSGYTISVPTTYSSGTVYSRTGMVITAPFGAGTGSANSTDRNGNLITTDGNGNFYDTLSSASAVLTVSGAGTPTSPVQFTHTAPSGATPSYKMQYANYNIETNFGCGNITDYGTNGTMTAYLVSEIDLPDIASNPNDKYTFTYEPTYQHSGYVTGRLASVTLPTGGSITYSYGANGTNGIECADGSASTLTRTLSDGATWSATWTYTRLTGTGAALETSVTMPDSNHVIMQFQGIYETQRDTYQDSAPTISSLPIAESTLQTSNLLQEVQTCYNNAAAPCTSTAVALPITKKTALNILPGTANLQSKAVTSYNGYGQLTEKDDYPFGSGAPGSTALRKKIITILAIGSYQAVQQVKIQDGSGNVLAQTTATFDEGSVAPSSGTPQHTSVAGGRGNPTTIKTLVQGTTTLNKTFVYYDTGTLKTATDANSAVTTYNYPDATSTCGNAFPTSISEPLSLSKYKVWNCTGAVETSATDENGKIVSTSYSDTAFWRPASVTDPTNAATSFCYGHLSSGSCTLNPNQNESTLAFNGSNSATDTLTALDGLGRVHIQQARQAPGLSNFDSVETDYDSVGRPYRVTTLYSASAGQTTSSGAPATTTTYDALGRVLTVTDAGGGTVTNSYTQNDVYQTLSPAPANENTKRRQSEYDALGRLTSVCEITNTLPGNGSCAQNSAQTGYWTKYAYDANGNVTSVTQNAQSGSSQQTRSYVYDDLSRLTQETNPENGITYYFYDTDPGTKGATNCSGTYNGDLVKSVDALLNVTCHTYDALHRNLSTTYAGTYSSVTPSRYFVYDAATVNGVTMGNAKTHLARAYTCFSPCTSNQTDLGLSYTARGEISDTYESMPHSSGYYYHVPASYWANGALNQLNNASCSGNPCLPGLTTFTYGADGEGRMSSVSAASGQNPVTGTTYNLYSSPPQTTVTFGSSDSDAFSFDANTGRMTQYKFNVGSQPQSMIGALTWNANGSLASLGITDPFNSANAQTCTYVHDDLQRIGGSSTIPGVNCVNGSQQTIWTNNFTYDAFGNINKSGTSSFNASYSAATNRMTQVGSSCTPQYDANGNATNDCLNTYAWDANGRPVTIGTVGAVYDALGRMVEQNRSGTYTEIVYSPSGGKLALMSGQTLQKAFIPLTGGAMAVYTGSGLDHYRHSDWLGSARLMTSPSRTVVGDVAYSPFGETYVPSGTLDLSFTGQNQDTSSNVYDFPAREHGIQGRWPSPDPAGIGATDSTHPQSWNRYAYVENNPLAATDPKGLFLKHDDEWWEDAVDPIGGGIGGFGWSFLCCGFNTSALEWGAPIMDYQAPPPPPDNLAPIFSDGKTAGGFGCESLGIPCGMQFPGGGGGDSLNLPGMPGSGCDFLACNGGFGNSLTDDGSKQVIKQVGNNFPGWLGWKGWNFSPNTCTVINGVTWFSGGVALASPEPVSKALGVAGVVVGLGAAVLGNCI